jgi:hypothetical protein
MAMTDGEQKDLRSYCAFILKEYGFHFSPHDPVIPALYIIHKEMQLNNQNNKTIAAQIKEASSKINPTTFHFNSPGEALKFQLGIAIKWISGSLLILVFIWTSAWYWSLVNDVDRARTIIQASDNLGELIQRVKINDEGYYFIDFTATKGDSIRHFTEYQKLNTKTVRVYLGRDTTISKP